MGSAELKAEELRGHFVPLPTDSFREPGAKYYTYLSLLTCVQNTTQPTFLVTYLSIVRSNGQNKQANKKHTKAMV